MTVAVYGAAGRTGQATLAELAAQGVPAVAVARRVPADASGAWRRADVDDPTSLRSALRGCRALLQCASLDASAASGLAETAIALGLPYVDVCADDALQDRLCRGPGRRAHQRGVPLCVGAAPIGGALGEWLALRAVDRLGRAAEAPTAVRLAYSSLGIPGSAGSLRSSLGMLARGPVHTTAVAFPPPFGTRTAFSFPLGATTLRRRLPSIPVHTYAALALGPVPSQPVATAVRAVSMLGPAVPTTPLAQTLSRLAGPSGALGGPLRFALVATARGRRHRHHAALLGRDPYRLTAAIVTAVVTTVLRRPELRGPVSFSELLSPRNALAALARRGFIRRFGAHDAAEAHP